MVLTPSTLKDLRDARAEDQSSGPGAMEHSMFTGFSMACVRPFQPNRGTAPGPVSLLDKCVSYPEQSKLTFRSKFQCAGYIEQF